MGRFGPSNVMTYEQIEETEELAELAQLIEEYEKLYERCMTPPYPMSAEESHRLNALYGALSSVEESFWVGASPRIVAMIQDGTNRDFPMILFKLGMLPGDNN